MATDERVSPPHSDLKKNFEDIVEAIEQTEDAGKEKFEEVCKQCNSSEIKSIITMSDDRVGVYHRFKAPDRSIIIERNTLTLLHYAVYDNHIETVKLLIENGADPSAEHSTLGTALHFASMSKSCDVEMMETIFTHSERRGKKIGRDIVNKVSGGWTALFYALERKDKLLVEFLLKNGADATSFVDGFGNKCTSFFFAAWSSSADIFKLMVEHYKLDYPKNKKELGELLNGTNDSRGILYSACRQCNIEMVKILLKYGADPSQPDEKGRNALHYAVECGDESVVKELLKDEKLDINSMDEEHHSVLWYALEYDVKPEMLELLLDKEAQVQAKELSRLIESDNYTDDIFKRIVMKLDQACFEKGLVEVETEECYGIFELAIKSNKPAKLEILSKMYKDKQKEGSASSVYRHFDEHFWKKYPFHKALEWGCSPDVIDVLKKCHLDHDHDEMILDDNGNTPLHCLSDATREDSLLNFMEKFDKELIKKMLNKKNEKDAGDTPLDIAVKKRRLSVVEIFLDKGAEIQTLSLSKAITEKNRECSLLFMKHCHKEIFSLLNADGEDGDRPFIQLIQEMPDVAKEALDRCMECDEEKARAMIYDRVECHKSSKYPLKEMIEDEGSFELLDHPVVTEVVRSKMYQYGYLIYITDILTHVLYLIFLSALSQSIQNPRDIVSFNGTSDANSGELRNQYNGLSATSLIFSLVRFLYQSCRFFFLLLFYFKKNCCKKRKRHNLSPQFMFPLVNRIVNYGRWAMYFSAIVISFIVFINGNLISDDAYNFIIIIVAMSWINFIIFLSDVPIIGIYARIYITIATTFLKLSIFALILVLGSTLVLERLFYKPDVPKSPFTINFGTAMAKVITMITGELGFESIFSLSYDVEDPKTTTPVINFPIAYIVWVAFLILIPISLANMLIGLAVGDVEKIRKEAAMKAKINQVGYIIEKEEFWSEISCKKIRCTESNCKKIQYSLDKCRKCFKAFVWDRDDEDLIPKSYTRV